MKNYEIHLGCIYQHSNGQICCVENIVGEDIFVNSKSGELWCFAEDLHPLDLDRGIYYIISNIMHDVNCIGVSCGVEFKTMIMQHVNNDTYIDHIFHAKYIHEAQLFIQLSCNEDIHEQLFNYLCQR